MRQLSGGALVFSLMAPGGLAQAGVLEFEPYVSAQYVYESNVYRFSSQVADATGTDETADRILRAAAGFDLEYLWQQQELRSKVEGRSVRFAEFTDLDHDGHLIDLGHVGHFLGHTKTGLNVSDERRMAAFDDRRSTELVIERDQSARGTLDVAVMPQWHVLAGARYRKLHSPLPAAPALQPSGPAPPVLQPPLPAPPAPQPTDPGSAARLASPDFTLREKALNLGLQHGIESADQPEKEAPLLVGIMLEHQTVNFTGLTPQPDEEADRFEAYRLLSLEGTVLYTVSGLSKLDGKLGVTQYKSSGNSTDPQLTGEIGYTRTLSALTEIEAKVYRSISSIASTAAAATDLGIGIGVQWEPILELMVVANYSWASSDFILSGVDSENEGREDRVQNVSLSFAYPLFQRFGIRLFGTRSDRSSSIAYNNYRDSAYGAELSFRWE